MFSSVTHNKKRTEKRKASDIEGCLSSGILNLIQHLKEYKDFFSVFSFNQRPKDRQEGKKKFFSLKNSHVDSIIYVT